MGTKIRAIVRNFSTGEVSPTIHARDDLAKYSAGCQQLENMIVQLHGSVRRRSGTYFVGQALAKSRLFTFNFNGDVEDIYVLVFSNLRLQIIQGYGFIETSPGNRLTIITTYTEAELPELNIAQRGDVVYIVHPNHAPLKLTRESHTFWTLNGISFEVNMDAPTGLSTVWSGSAGGTATIEYQITAVNEFGEQSLPSAITSCTGKPMNDWVSGDYVTVGWTAVTDAVEYNVYKSLAGQFGLVGIVTTNSFKDYNYVPDTTSGTPIEKIPFVDGNYPAHVCFHQQRLLFAGGTENPWTIYGSQVANFENFNTSRPLIADDSYEHMLDSVTGIAWVMPFNDLLIGTATTEFAMNGGGSGVAITPLSALVRPQSFWGSANINPLVVGTSLVHVQSQAAAVRDLFYSLEKDGYDGNNLSVLATHLFDGYQVVEWAYQQTPDSVIWAIRSDGVLLGLTYLKEHQIWGWHRHTTQGEYESVAVVPDVGEDVVYTCVKRVVNGTTRHYIERMEPVWRARDGLDSAFFVDSGLTYSGTATTTVTGLGHLEGETVVALADGGVRTDLVVSSGAITLPAAASTVHVGLPYDSIVSPLPVQLTEKNTTTHGMLRGFGQIEVDFQDTVGGNVGWSADDVVLVKTTPVEWGEAVDPVSGWYVQAFNGGSTRDLSVYVTQDAPLPLTVRAIIMEIDFANPG